MSLFNKKITIKEQSDNIVYYKSFADRKLRLNSDLVVPKNFVCYIFANEKLLDVYSEGEVKLYALTMPKTSREFRLEKPRKDKGFIKAINADLLFVNLLDHKICGVFKVKKNKLKNNLKFDLSFRIKDPKLFLEFLLDEVACFKNDYAQKQLQYYVSYIIYYYFLDYDYEEKDIENYVIKKLNKIGIEALDFNIELNNTTKTTRANEHSNIISENIENFSNCNSSLENQNFKINSAKDNIVDISDVDNKKIEYFKCETCGAFLMKGAKRCFNCNTLFEDESLIHCENCGCVIDEHTHVCPNCHVVLF